MGNNLHTIKTSLEQYVQTFHALADNGIYPHGYELAREAEANTAYIVQAVNAHEGLVKALRDCMEFLDSVPRPAIRTQLDTLSDSARAALTLATKED